MERNDGSGERAEKVVLYVFHGKQQTLFGCRIVIPMRVFYMLAI